LSAVPRLQAVPRPEPPQRAAATADRPDYQKFDVAVRKSRIDGFGVFAAEAIPALRKIGEIRGETISVSEARRRAEGKARIMIVEISPKKAIDASGSTDPMRFTNHGCQPNARLTIRAGRIEFYALRPITPGEEITVNYGETHHEGTLACRCGMAGCIGFL
jgi:SET domain-containing protein